MIRSDTRDPWTPKSYQTQNLMLQQYMVPMEILVPIRFWRSEVGKGHRVTDSAYRQWCNTGPYQSITDSLMYKSYTWALIKISLYDPVTLIFDLWPPKCNHMQNFTCSTHGASLVKTYLNIAEKLILSKKWGRIDGSIDMWKWTTRGKKTEDKSIFTSTWDRFCTISFPIL